MKKIIYFAFAAVIGAFVFVSCNKDNGPTFDPSAQFELEKPIIKNYVTANYPNMVYSSDTTGMWFEVLEPGVTDSYKYVVVDTIDAYGVSRKMVRPPEITVRYTGKLISNNTVFDSNNTTEGFKSKLDRVIPAWQIAFQPKSIGEYKIGGLLPKGLQVGSKIRFVTPSYFAYGNRDLGKIPANSPLYFEIEVLSIK